MVLCFLWQSSHQETVIRSLRPDLKNWRQGKQWKPLANYAALLARCSLPRLALHQGGCFPVTVLCVEPRKLLFRPPIWMKRGCWMVGWPVLGCCTVLRARTRGTLVPMPSCALLRRLTRLPEATTLGLGELPQRGGCMGGRRQAG